MDDNWSNLPPEILIEIVQRLCYCDNYIRLIAVCKSWRDSVGIYETPCLLPPRYPFLLLAEEVAPGALYSDGEYDSNVDYGDTTDEEDNVGEGVEAGEEEDIGDDDDDDEEEDEDDRYDHNKNSVGSSRGLYSLLTGKTYYIDLPEAAARLIFGINKGWLVTLGRDLQINLLHPLLRYQISLPPMLTFPQQYDYDEDYMPEEASDMFIRKLAISSKILNKNTAASLYHHNATPTPIVMAIYGECGFLGFARLGDKAWTDVNVPSRSFYDIAYHNGNFYAVDNHGVIFVCGIDDDKEGGDIRGREIVSLETNDWDQKYLVESSSGSGLLLLVRIREVKHFDRALCRRSKYRTTGFSVWRLDLKSSGCIENISCTLTEEKYLGNEAIFIGRNSSVSMSSSEFIKPNSIYFTDDNWVTYYHDGGGHDMGIFDIKSRTIEPHYPGKSIHPISPPLWYI